jgi:hypothetical protein
MGSIRLRREIRQPDHEQHRAGRLHEEPRLAVGAGGALVHEGYRNGDANLDDKIDLADFNILASNFGQSVNGWAFADFNLDASVDLSDFNMLAANFGLGAASDGPLPQDWSNLAAAVPEPAALALPLAVIFVGFARATRTRA